MVAMVTMVTNLIILHDVHNCCSPTDRGHCSHFRGCSKPLLVPSFLVAVCGLKSYKGVERRFSYRIKSESFVFIDDYAHHPKEIDAVWEAVSEMYPQKKVTAVFQPHLYSRTLDFAVDFAVSLSKFDAVLLLDIYPAREAPIPGVTSNLILEKITAQTKQLVQKSALLTSITSIGNPVLITMGAGDIDQEVEPLTKNLIYA